MSGMLQSPSVFRSRAMPGRLSPRAFSTTPPSLSALFNLNGLAHSRESQYLSKERGIPRTEYSSNIHLIRSSEVDPFPNAPGASKHAISAPEGRLLSKKQAGHPANTVATERHNESPRRAVNGTAYPSHKTIEELRSQLRAVIAENEQLRRAMLQKSNKDDAGTRISKTLFGEIWRVCLFLVGLYAIVSFYGTMAFPKDASKEVDQGVPDSRAAAATETEFESEDVMPVTSPDSVTAAQVKVHDSQPSRKDWNPLKFLWA